MSTIIKKKILVAEDDRKTADLIRAYLESNGFWVLIAHDGQQALHLARSRQPHLIVLDLMLPSLDGIEICRLLRDESISPSIPIIMLTAKSTEDDKLFGLDVGADDYMTKPFSPRELVARVKAVLRRTQSDDEVEEVSFGDLSINFIRYEVWARGQKLSLTPKEFKLLAVLVKSPNRAFSRRELVETAFGHNYDGLERTVDVHMMKLRKKVENDSSRPVYIQTVFGVGYKFNIGD